MDERDPSQTEMVWYMVLTVIRLYCPEIFFGVR